jgi:hypothetical protein
MVTTKAKCLEDALSTTDIVSATIKVESQAEKLQKIGPELKERVKQLESTIERLTGYNDNQRVNLERCLQRIKLLEGENDVLKRTNAALWDRFLGRPPAARDLHNDVVVHTVDEVLRQLGDGTAQATLDAGSDRGTPGDGHWFG